MRSVGVELSGEQASKLLSAFDGDGSGSVDFAEFLVMAVSQAGSRPVRLTAAQVRQMQRTFARYDANKSGLSVCVCVCVRRACVWAQSLNVCARALARSSRHD